MACGLLDPAKLEHFDHDFDDDCDCDNDGIEHGVTFSLRGETMDSLCELFSLLPEDFMCRTMKFCSKNKFIVQVFGDKILFTEDLLKDEEGFLIDGERVWSVHTVYDNVTAQEFLDSISMTAASNGTAGKPIMSNYPGGDLYLNVMINGDDICLDPFTLEELHSDDDDDEETPPYCGECTCAERNDGETVYGYAVIEISDRAAMSEENLFNSLEDAVAEANSRLEEHLRTLGCTEEYISAREEYGSEWEYITDDNPSCAWCNIKGHWDAHIVRFPFVQSEPSCAFDESFEGRMKHISAIKKGDLILFNDCVYKAVSDAYMTDTDNGREWNVEVEGDGPETYLYASYFDNGMVIVLDKQSADE